MSLLCFWVQDICSNASWHNRFRFAEIVNIREIFSSSSSVSSDLMEKSSSEPSLLQLADYKISVHDVGGVFEARLDLPLQVNIPVFILAILGINKEASTDRKHYATQRSHKDSVSRYVDRCTRSTPSDNGNMRCEWNLRSGSHLLDVNTSSGAIGMSVSLSFPIDAVLVEIMSQVGIDMSLQQWLEMRQSQVADPPDTDDEVNFFTYGAKSHEDTSHAHETEEETMCVTDHCVSIPSASATPAGYCLIPSPSQFPQCEQYADMCYSSNRKNGLKNRKLTRSQASQLRPPVSAVDITSTFRNGNDEAVGSNVGDVLVRNDWDELWYRDGDSSIKVQRGFFFESSEVILTGKVVHEKLRVLLNLAKKQSLLVHRSGDPDMIMTSVSDSNLRVPTGRWIVSLTHDRAILNVGEINIHVVDLGAEYELMKLSVGLKLPSHKSRRKTQLVVRGGIQYWLTDLPSSNNFAAEISDMEEVD